MRRIGPWLRSAMRRATVRPAMHRINHPRLVLAAAALVFAAPLAVLLAALDSTDHAQAQTPQERHAACLDRVVGDPAGALDEAEAWEIEDGGTLARHCGARALLALRRADEAGRRLETLAREVGAHDPMLGAALFGEAADAWLIQGAPNRALRSADDGLVLAPGAVELLTSRATALVAAERPDEALGAIEAALSANPDDPTLLVLKSSILLRLDRRQEALATVEEALDAAPDDPDALLQRGNLRRLGQDIDGAREDWRRVLSLAPDSPAGRAAAANLERATQIR